MGSAKTDITHRLDRLVQIAEEPGCSIWLSMIYKQIDRASKEIKKLRNKLGIETPPAPWERYLEDQPLELDVEKPLIGFDYETWMMAAGRLAPPWVCGSLATIDATNHWQTYLGISSEPQSMQYVRDTVLSPECRKVAHNASFDLAVLCANSPESTSRVFEMLVNEEVHDTLIREKLLNLTDHGSLEYYNTGKEQKARKIFYDLASLSKFYLGKDRSDQKKGEDVWRTNYIELDGVPREQWPQEAIDYAIEDSMDVVLIHAEQEKRRQEIWHRSGQDPFVTESTKVAVDFALFLASIRGMQVDPNKKAEIERGLAEELSEEKLSLLLQYKILRPAVLPRPYANGATNEDGTPKMTGGKKASINTARLKSHMIEVAKLHPGMEIWKTSKSEKFPNGDVSTKAEWFEEYAALDPVLQQYQHRQSLQKMVSTEMPRLCTKDEKGKSTGICSPVVHASFNVLVETGRTSSRGVDSYPSLNGQNVDPRARPCIVPREGYLLFSVDYNQMELGTLAQKCYELFGFSVLRDTINAGIDVHEYTGAQLAFHLDHQFQQMAVQANKHNTPGEIREFFHLMKEHSPAFYKHWRKFAKPTNLGYPGGLGPKTFIAYAKSPYGVIVDLDMATRLKELWMMTYPEMDLYFKFIKEQCVDHRNGPKITIDENGKEKKQDLYAYTTVGGLHRAGATFCAAANGIGLQSPSAVGATLGLFNVQRACYDPAMMSILADDAHGPTLRVNNFIHDEIMGEVRHDGMEHDRVMEVARIMVEAMRTVTPDVTPRAEACLMRRWNKFAEPVFDANNRLIPWEPKE